MHKNQKRREEFLLGPKFSGNRQKWVNRLEIRTTMIEKSSLRRSDLQNDRPVEAVGIERSAIQTKWSTHETTSKELGHHAAA